jgi:thioredoxin-dependent peroxiredoxin
MKKLFGLLAVMTVCLTALAALATAMPQAGTPAPAFTLPGQDGKDVSLSDYRGKWVVLYFYPKDQTPG